LNLADYSRYLCEISIAILESDDIILETDLHYQTFFKLLEDQNITIVNPPYLTGIYHYAKFIYEVKLKSNEAIEFLKQKRKLILEKLDEVYKNYSDSYPILDMISDTLANWIIFQKENEEYIENNNLKHPIATDLEKNKSLNNTRDVKLPVMTD